MYIYLEIYKVLCYNIFNNLQNFMLQHFVILCNIIFYKIGNFI